MSKMQPSAIQHPASSPPAWAFCFLILHNYCKIEIVMSCVMMCHVFSFGSGFWVLGIKQSNM